MTFKPLFTARLAALSFAAFSFVAAAQSALIETNQGNITVELNSAAAPVSVKNFASYADKHHYDGTIFHRVIRNFMIQGGGFDASMSERPTAAPIVNEATNGLKNDKYTIAMARTNEVNSATSQFFINTKDNDFLNNQMGSYGYAVFGKVTAGFDVVDKIGEVYTTSKAGMGDVPITPIVIQKITVTGVTNNAAMPAISNEQPAPTKKSNTAAAVAGAALLAAGAVAIKKHAKKRKTKHK